MTDVLSRSFPPPIDWQAFERLCFDLYSRIWKTNDAELHGRTGQPQAGVDVYGHDRVENKFVGVQCKGRDEGYDAHLTPAEIRAEVAKAKTFEPALDVFIIATTAPNDVSAQRVAREITAQHATTGEFEVRVQGWQTLKQRITDYGELLSKHFPDLSPFDILTPISSQFEQNQRSHDTTHTLLNKANAAVALILERVEPTDELSGRIDEAIKLIEGGFLSAALSRFEQLWRDHADTATKEHKYRIRANIALIKMSMDRKSEAISEFKAAYNEYPEWPKAQAVLATVYLLEGDRTQAFELAKAILESDPGIQQAATVLVDAAPEELSASDVITALPEALRGRVETLLGLSMRASKQRDFAAAEQFARDAFAESPDDWKTLAGLAETLLAPVSEVSGIGLTGRIPPSLQESFNLVERL
jgi:tetratricopeptide (TPR) repeat protein